MPSIIRYQPVSDNYTTYYLQWDQSTINDDSPKPIEIARLDGYYYVALPDGYTLPAQPDKITIEPVTLTDELKDKLRKASSLIQHIDLRVREKIAARYSISDEIKLLRTAPSAEYEMWNAYAEECRDWGRAEKAKLGL